MKKILILVAGDSNLPFIQAAKNLGYYIITCDNNPSNLGHQIADENLFINVYDHESIIEAIKDKNIDSVMSFVSAHGLNTASIISEHFQLGGYTQIALKTLSNKALFRDFLSRNRLNFPAYQYVHNQDEIKLNEITYPIIIKPTDKGGSQGVIKINNESELFLNFQTSKNFSESDTVIIEEFLEGEEIINGDCIIHNGKIIGSIIGNYIFDNDVNDVLPIATFFPAKHDASETLKQLSEIINTLEIPDGIINFEAIIKNNKSYIVEINPRPSGNYIWKLLSYKYCIDIPPFLIKLQLKLDTQTSNLEVKSNQDYAYQLIYSDKDKLLKEFETPSAFKKNIIEMISFKQKNERVSLFKNLHDRIGIILLKFNSDKEKVNYFNSTKLFKI